MALTLEEALNLTKDITSRIRADNKTFSLVCTIGGTPKEFGEYLAREFSCDYTPIPSTGIQTQLKVVLRATQRYAKSLPEPLRYPLAKIYQEVRRRSPTIYPSYCSSLLSRGGEGNVLLFDDDVNTGNTIQFWKDEFGKVKRQTYSATLTSVGAYKPDYLGLPAWRSFEWRAIGV